MVSYDFDGTTVFITGAGRGQGQTHAVQFAEHGADVVATDLERPRATAEMVRDAGGDALALAADVTDEAAVAEAVEEAIDRFGTIDVLVNNAGVWTIEEPTELSEADWDAVVDVNLKGAFLCAKHVGAHMADRGQGVIVNIASVAGLVGFPHSAHYTASKHGVVGLTKSLAVDLAEFDIRVNAVCPGSVGTPMLSEAFAGADEVPDFEAVIGRFNLFEEDVEAVLDPEEVSEAVCWLASDAARAVTGASLPVDAGLTAK